MNSYLRDSKVSGYRLDIEINKSNDHFKKLCRRMDLLKWYVNRNKRNKTLRRNSRSVVKIMRAVRDEARIAYKEEWESIKAGERVLIKHKKRALSGIVGLVIFYVAYAIFFYLIKDGGSELVIKVVG